MGDVLLVDGRVAARGGRVEGVGEAEVVEAAGLVVAPGLIDVHVHLREPGGEHKETIATGARAAAAGGFTSVCAMPNTNPPIDDPASVGFVVAEGRRAGGARVHPLGAISVGQEGRRLAEIGELVAAGAVGITDDGRPVMDSGLMRLALEYALPFGIPVADHPEDLGLSREGVMNEGLVSTRLGLVGKPNAAEDVHIVRDLLLAELTGGRIHLQHVSTAWGVEAIRQAKARGVRATAEASPHHLILTEAAVEGYRTEAKMNPPLRTAADVAAVRQGLADGTLDVIATDHAPHHYDEKESAFDDAPFGIVGLETALGLVLTPPRRRGCPRPADRHRPHEPVPRPRLQPARRDPGSRERGRRDPHRPEPHVGGGAGALPIEEPQHPVRRLRADREGRDDHRGWNHRVEGRAADRSRDEAR